MIGVGVFLGVIGPFGSFYGGSLEIRIGYWIANSWIGFIVVSVAVRLSLLAAFRFDLPSWFALGMGAAIGALPTAIVLDGFSAWFWPGNHGQVTPLLIQYGNVLVIAEPFSFAYYFLVEHGWRAASRSAPPPTVSVEPRPSGGGFLDRLPPRLGRDLLCLQMEDHYVRAHTAKGSDLVLIPLKAAIAELAETDGLQVHRSWWVARSAVVEPKASGRRISLRLSTGLEVPVSRASVAKLRAAGWFAGRMNDARLLKGSS